MPTNQQTVTPWSVKGTEDGINYKKLIEEFGCQAIDGQLIKRFEKVTKTRAHTWLRRGLFFSNKDLNDILDDFEKGKPIYIYTGRGPSSDQMHLGHLVPFLFTRYLQEALGAIVIIQMSDDEKFYFKGKTASDLEQFNQYAYLNAQDIIACGFQLEKTYIFSNLEKFGGALYWNAVKIMKSVTGNQIRGTYGLDLNNNLGQLIWPALQCTPAYSSSFPSIFGKEPVRCLVPMAIDQDPYFRMARDVAHNLEAPKPSTMHSRFLVGLRGIQEKMNTTGENANATLFLNAAPQEVRKMIKKHAFSGGGETLKEHEELGGDLHTDVAFQYLLYFEHDDAKMSEIAHDYRSGKLKSGEIKSLMADAVCRVLIEHQARRAEVTPEIIKEYFNIQRDFDLTLPVRPEIELFSDELYATWGINFDTSFGAGHKINFSKEELEKARPFYEIWKQQALSSKSDDTQLAAEDTATLTSSL